MSQNSCVLVSKVGGVFRCGDAALTARGEAGETEGVLRWLVKEGHNVVYFGKYKGDMIPGVKAIQPDVDGGLDADSSWNDQLDRFLYSDVPKLNEAFNELGQPLCFLEMCGFSPTWCTLGNFNRVNIYSSGVRFTGPQMMALEYYKIPRICINTDPRTYPKSQEMSLGTTSFLKPGVTRAWTYNVPAALLDQREGSRQITVGGRGYRRISVHARAESWAWLPSRENQKLDPAVCVAHAHMGCGIGGTSARVSSGQVQAWSLVLGEHPVHLPNNFHIYGRGWEHYPYRKGLTKSKNGVPDLFMGEVTPLEVRELFNMHLCGPVVSHTPEFYTGKPYVMVAQGCIPLLFGDGEHPYTYDHKGLLKGLRAGSRLRQPGDLRRLAETLWNDPNLYDETINAWKEKCKPDFSRLEECLDALALGDPAIRSGDWYSRFGGYMA